MRAMARNPQYWYGSVEPAGQPDPRDYDRPRRGHRVELEPPMDEADDESGHGLAELYPRDREQPRGIPRARAPWDDRRHFGYGREHFYGDPYGTGAPPAERSYGELYGRDLHDYGDRRLPLYREPMDWPDGFTERSGDDVDIESGEPIGPHVGVGPAGWSRSDERILDDVADRLARNGWVDASEVRLEVADGVVRIEGSVPSRRGKHLVEDLASEATGVVDVDNRLRVPRRGRSEEL